MSNVDRKRKVPKTSRKTSSVFGTIKRHASGKTPRYDSTAPGAFDSYSSAFSPSHHLVSFQPQGSTNVAQVEQSSELDKLSSKLFGIPLLSGTNFGLRIHAGTDSHVPLVVKDTVDWLGHYGTLGYLALREISPSSPAFPPAPTAYSLSAPLCIILQYTTGKAPSPPC